MLKPDQINLIQNLEKKKTWNKVFFLILHYPEFLLIKQIVLCNPDFLNFKQA